MEEPETFCCLFQLLIYNFCLYGYGKKSLYILSINIINKDREL